jgi:hypothetical protein
VQWAVEGKNQSKIPEGRYVGDIRVETGLVVFFGCADRHHARAAERGLKDAVGDDVKLWKEDEGGEKELAIG